MKPKTVVSGFRVLQIAGAAGAAFSTFSHHPHVVLLCFVVVGFAGMMLTRFARASPDAVKLSKPIPVAHFYIYMVVALVISVCASLYVILVAHGVSVP
jgi:fluoride ion exporter CrcB/FEX